MPTNTYAFITQFINLKLSILLCFCLLNRQKLNISNWKASFIFFFTLSFHDIRNTLNEAYLDEVCKNVGMRDVRYIDPLFYE